MDLAGKRVAVIGTGASAIQFVPAIAGRVEVLHVFQRSPSHMMPRPDRAYSGLEKVLFGRVSGAMRLHRAWIYLKYESRALAFTRFKWLMQWAVGRPFRKMLERQVPDAAHRSITTRLALSTGAVVTVPDYRLAPEHPYPAALDDARACYQALLARGVAPGRIVLAGDSAGGALAMALLLSLKRAGQPMPAGALLISPVTDPALRRASLANLRAGDPMIREGWLRQGLAWYGAPAAAGEHQPLAAELSGLPPVMIQVGEQEVLRDDSLRLADRLQQAGVECRLHCGLQTAPRTKAADCGAIVPG